MRQYRDLMQLVLLGAGIVAVLVRQWGTTALLFGLTFFNARLGLRQEAKARRSLASLREMFKPEASVLRDGTFTTIPAEELVPGDVVALDHGDRVPADGRLIDVQSFEAEESSLTGEGVPVIKKAAAVDADAALADRVDMVFANTNATRGSGRFIVTSTGMSTQVGHIAGMLRDTGEEKTPLTRQIDQLSRIIVLLAGAAFVGIVVTLRVSQGESWSALFQLGVALAVGSIPDALPAVVTSVLAVGTEHMAKRNANRPPRPWGRRPLSVRTRRAPSPSRR